MFINLFIFILCFSNLLEDFITRSGLIYITDISINSISFFFFFVILLIISKCSFDLLIKLSFLSTAIGRTLIPRYFRSIFEGGATELFYVLKHPKESFHSNFVSLDCDQCTMVTQNGKPMFTQVRLMSHWMEKLTFCCWCCDV